MIMIIIISVGSHMLLSSTFFFLKKNCFGLKKKKFPFALRWTKVVTSHVLVNKVQTVTYSESGTEKIFSQKDNDGTPNFQCRIIFIFLKKF